MMGYEEKRFDCIFFTKREEAFATKKILKILGEL